jgi:hypothetical protein
VGADDVDFSEVYRIEGSVITVANLAARVRIGGVIDAPTVSALDTTSKNNVTYLYIVLAQFNKLDENNKPIRSGIAVSAPFTR